MQLTFWQRLVLKTGRWAAMAWTPAVVALSMTVAFAAEEPISEAPGIHLSVGTLSLLLGILAIIGPVFYILGRYDHRLTSTEKAIIHLDTQMEHMVERSIKTGDRVAEALESIAERGVHIECHGPAFDGKR